jgi:aldose 1-epimerase
MSKPAQKSFASNDLELVVLPEIGARWHRLRAFGQDVLRTPKYLKEHVRDTFFWGAYPMAPWAGRVDATSLVVANQQVTFKPNFPDGTAIHGQVYQAPWTVEDDRTFRIEAGEDGWPWPYEVTMAVDVHDAVMRVDYAVTNLSDEPMPAGVGVHPWWRKPLDVAIHAAGVLTPNWATPAEPEPVHDEFDLRRLRPMPPDVDATWTDVTQPPVELSWPTLGLKATLRAQGPGIYIVAASPNHLDAVALEAQTNAPQAIRRLLNGERGAPVLLEPEGVLRLGVELTFERTGPEATN